MKNRLFFLSMFASLMIVLSMQNVFAYTSADLAVVSANFGRSDCSELNNWCSGADMNRDGNVSIGDVVILAENNVSNQQVAQEPSASPVSSSGSGGGVIFAPLSAKKSATSDNGNSADNLEAEVLTQIETNDATFLDGSFNYLMESVESKNSQMRLGASVVILFSAGLLLYFRKKRN